MAAEGGMAEVDAARTVLLWWWTTSAEPRPLMSLPKDAERSPLVRSAPRDRSDPRATVWGGGGCCWVWA